MKIKKGILLIYLFATIFFIANFLNLKNLNLIDWDEGVFALQGKWLSSMENDGKPFNFQTPPIFPIIIAIFFKIFGTQDYILPLISIIFSSLTIIFLFNLCKILYSESTGIFAVFLFALTEYFLFFSKSGLSDATFLFFFIASLYFFYRGVKFQRNADFLLCGVFTTFSLYTKYTGPLLIFIYLITGIFQRRKISKNFFLFTIIIPTILFLPYLFIFIKVITITGIVQRHKGLWGINHLKYIYYLFRFAPLTFITAILYRMKKESDFFILKVLLIYFLFLGFYYPYFRLAYPIIPLLAIFSAGFLFQFKKWKYYLLIGIIALSFVLNHRTITYHSSLPQLIKENVDFIAKEKQIPYIYTLVPPNILFYIKGKVIYPEGHISDKLLNNLGLSAKFEFMKIDENLIERSSYVLFIYSSIFEDLNDDFEKIKTFAILVDSFEFIDAPVYYKDIFNPLRDKRQIYNLYLFETTKINPIDLKNLWEFGFKPQVNLIRYDN